MKFNLSLALVISLIFTLPACTSSEKEEESEEQSEETEAPVLKDDSIINPVDSLHIPPGGRRTIATLICREIGNDGDDFPRFEISLRASDITAVLDTVHACQVFEPSEYFIYEIPKNAVSGAGGWFNGTGEYFYMMEENTDLVVYSVWLKEEQTTNKHFYKEIYRLQLPEIELE